MAKSKNMYNVKSFSGTVLAKFADPVYAKRFARANQPSFIENARTGRILSTG